MAIIQTTIKDLRLFSGTPSLTDSFYVTDEGMEGFWTCDPSIQTFSFTDNLGTKLNTGWTLDSNGNYVNPTTYPQYEFKRVYQEYVNVKWFGATGNGTTDDIMAIQAAVDYVSKTEYADIWNNSQLHHFGGGTVFFPEGRYKITKNILVGQHCKLLGVSKGGYGYPYRFSNQTGSVISCYFPIDNENEEQKWAIQTACYWTNSPGNLPPNPLIINQIGEIIKKDYAVKAEDFDGKKIPNSDDLYPPSITNAPGVTIEGLIILGQPYGEDNKPLPGFQCFGGIKLSGSPNSLILNVEVFHVKIGFMLSACWGSAMEGCCTLNIDWYGVVLRECNGIKLSACYIKGLEKKIDHSSVLVAGLEFVYKLNNTNYEGLNQTAYEGSTGIYAVGMNSLSLNSCVIESFDNGVFSIWAEIISTSLYIENMFNYGIVLTGPVLSEFVQTFFAITPSAFFVGEGPKLEVSTVKITTSVGNLCVDNDVAYRQIYFNQVRNNEAPLGIVTGKRAYKRDIVFLDEVSGCVYVDSLNGDDMNFGYSERDAVRTFDAALIRVQNAYVPANQYQKAIYSRINTIYIKAAQPISGEVNAQTGAAFKNLNVVSIENCDILIASYGVDETHPKARIFFEGDTSPEQIAMIGQIELMGNVNLYFRNVDLICNTSLSMSSDPVNLSMFGLTNSYAKVTFESNDEMYPVIPIIPSTLGNIYLDLPYFIFQVNTNLSMANPPRAIIDVKFLNVKVVGGAGLSSSYSGTAVLGVDCVQMNSLLPASYFSLTNNGWQDAIIIRNNF
ncbi:MAG: glycosyl hydrolase family 28-related protein, partial [Bacteroidia bacterium]